VGGRQAILLVGGARFAGRSPPAGKPISQYKARCPCPRRYTGRRGPSGHRAAPFV